MTNQSPSRRPTPLLLTAGLLLSACTDSAGEGSLDAESDSDAANDGQAEASGEAVVELPPVLNLDVPDPASIYDPVAAGETLPDGFRQVLARDAIAPVYDPVFTLADQVDWPQDSLVIGVDLNDEARAYPVGFLNRREIVNDDHRGIPTLVTW